MSLNKKDAGVIAACIKSLTGGVETLHAAVVYGVKKAYSDKADNGLFLRELAASLPVAYLSPVVHFLRRAGINATMDGKTSAVVGGALDPKKQRNKIDWAASAAGDLLALVAADVPAVKAREKKTPTGTFTEQANKVIERVIKAQKKSNPDVAAIIADKLNKLAAPEWTATFDGVTVSKEEAEMMLDGLMAYRAEQFPMRKAA